MQDLAANPHQYDSPDLDWSILGDENHSSRIYFRNILDEVTPPDSFRDKNVLDIGCGVGQLFKWLEQRGASAICGIDPSIRNIEICKERYPSIETSTQTLSEFASMNERRFDVAIAVMVFEHILDIGEASKEVFSLLNPGDLFYLIIGDKEHGISSDPQMRGTRFVSVDIIQDFGNGMVETKTIRDDGEGQLSTMYDIYRPVEDVRKAASDAGFQIVSESELRGPYTLPPEERTYTSGHFLAFRKV